MNTKTLFGSTGRSRLSKKRDEYQKRIDGIRERISSTETCSICYQDISKKSISPCCSNAYCFLCINIWLTRDFGPGRCPTCPMCKTNMMPTDLLVVDDTYDGAPVITDDAVNDIFDKVKNMEIILRQREEGSKFLIYSSHDMSFTNIIDTLVKNGIRYAYLKGPEAYIKKVIARFKNGELHVLLVNGRCYGAGLNLEFTTDIIMFHRMESETEKQIIGRAQRHPREIPLRVHYMLYENEMR